MQMSPEQLAIAGAAAAIGLGVIVLLRTLMRGRQADAPRVDPEQARLLADMKELTDRLAGELEARSARLEKLLAEADRRVRDLEAARDAGPREAAPVVVMPAARSRVEPMHARVHELADQGLTPIQIAESTGVPTGQVELVLALRRAGARG